jgi:DNA (cytosine-5)-methyltransferase 1
MVDLFCGAGGLSLGFSQEGFVTALANDIEECCIDTYAHNHPETPRDHIVLGDIRNVVDHLEELLKGKTIDIVVGGPPCQGFSMANRQRLIDDPRNHLYKNYVEVVRRVQPAFFVMENVKGMLSVAEQVKEDFKGIGYTVECHILNARDFGVPQNRERLIYIGNRIGVDNEKIFEEIFEMSKDIPNHVLEDALFALRPLEASRIRNSTEQGSEQSGFKIEKNAFEVSNEYIEYINQGRKCPVTLNHKARYNNDRDIEIFGRMYQGDKSDDPKIADIMPYARRNGIFKDKYFKLEEKKICKTITAHMKFDCNMYIHPTQARGLTPREAARVQSYPDDYYFRGAYTKTYMQIGNSVPPLLGRAIAHVVKKYINRRGGK